VKAKMLFVNGIEKKRKKKKERLYAVYVTSDSKNRTPQM
jgi:hypothetical protein